MVKPKKTRDRRGGCEGNSSTKTKRRQKRIWAQFSRYNVNVVWPEKLPVSWVAGYTGHETCGQFYDRLDMVWQSNELLRNHINEFNECVNGLPELKLVLKLTFNLNICNEDLSGDDESTRDWTMRYAEEREQEERQKICAKAFLRLVRMMEEDERLKDIFIGAWSGTTSNRFTDTLKYEQEDIARAWVVARQLLLYTQPMEQQHREEATSKADTPIFTSEWRE